MITLTPAAAGEVKRLIEKAQKPNLGLRVGVKGGGCSGMTYVLAVEDATPKQYDTVFEQDGVKVVVDAKSRDVHVNPLSPDAPLLDLLAAS